MRSGEGVSGHRQRGRRLLYCHDDGTPWGMPCTRVSLNPVPQDLPHVLSETPNPSGQLEMHSRKR